MKIKLTKVEFPYPILWEKRNIRLFVEGNRFVCELYEGASTEYQLGVSFCSSNGAPTEHDLTVPVREYLHTSIERVWESMYTCGTGEYVQMLFDLVKAADEAYNKALDGGGCWKSDEWLANN